MRNNQKGFSAVEGLLILVIVSLICFVGWYVWHTKSSVDTTYNSAANSTPKTSSTPSIQKDGDWTVVTSTKVSLAKWGLTITLPTKLLSKAVYKYDTTSTYDFSLRSIVDNASCLEYYATVLESPEGDVSVGQYSMSTLVQGHLQADSSTTDTLLDYYNQHKSASGNYFTDSDGRIYYKIGNFFYVLFNYSSASSEQQSTFSTACPGVDLNWQQDFINAMQTLHPN